MTKTFTYDALNRIQQIDYPDSTSTYYSYTNGAGVHILDVAAVVDRLGNWTRYEYDGLRRVYYTTNSAGQSTLTDYCLCGGPATVTRGYGTPLAEDTVYTHDYQGNITQVVAPGSVTVSYGYDLLRRRVIESDALSTTTNLYDNLNRLVLSQNGAGYTKVNIYDSEDHLTGYVDQNGVISFMEYDDLGRLTVKQVSGGGTELFGYTQNVAGMTSYTNQLGKVTRYEYHAAGWKTNEVYVGVSTNSFDYSPSGDLVLLRDGKNQLTTWGYDIYGRVTSKTNANNAKILSYGYDANNRLTHRWSLAKLDTWYDYDGAGNLTNIDYNASTDIQYKYDVLNRLTNMVDAVGTTTWTYDSANRFTVEDGPWASDNVTNRWNTVGLRTNLAILQPASYFNVDYEYDSTRRLSSVDSTAGTFDYTYNTGLNSLTTSSKLVDRLDLPNTSYIQNTWDDVGRLTDTYLKNSSGTALNRHSYTYNNGNQRTRQTFTDAGYVDYLYDDVGELYSARTYNSGGTENLAQRYGYDYDPAWNLNKRTNNATVSSFNVNNQNQLTSSPEGTHSYDGNGNMTTAGELHLGYDDENQMVTAIVMATDWMTGSKTDYTYDGKMRLRKAVDYSWNWIGGTNGTWSLINEKRYIYDGMLVVQERNSGNTPLVTYTRGNDLSGTLQGAGGISGMLARSQSYSAGNWLTHHFYHADGNGNITYLVNSSQTLGASYKYNPFGGTISSSGTYAVANRYRFSSKEVSLSTGTYYYGYRWYHPNLQRWLNRDPIGENQFENNVYRFALNRPINIVDIVGLFPYHPFGWPLPPNKPPFFPPADPKCQERYECRLKCQLGWALCKTAAFAVAAACRNTTRAGCATSCAGTGPAAIACIVMCISSGEAGCGWTAALMSETCDAIRDKCLASCDTKE